MNLHPDTPSAHDEIMTLAEFAEHLDQVLYLTNLEPHRVLYANPAFEKIWGLSRESLYADIDTYRNSVHPEDRHRVQTVRERILAGQEIAEIYRIVRPDGETRWISMRSFPQRDETGRIVRTVGVCEDITRHRKVEAELREHTASLQRVIEVSGKVAAELDLTRLVQSVTDAATQLCEAEFGAFFYNVLDEQGARYTLYTLSGAPLEAFSGYPMPRATQLFGPTFRGEGTIRIDNVREDPRYGHEAPYHGMPPGHLPVVSYLAVPVISRSGEVLGGLFFGHAKPGIFTEEKTRLVELLAAQASVAMDNAHLFDLAQRERAAARASEQDYQFLAESIPQIVWVANPDGSLSYINQRWSEYTGRTPGNGLDWGWQQIIHPEDLPVCIERWSRSLQGGHDFELEYRLRRLDGEYRWHLGRAVPLRDENGQVIKWFGTATDINDQKRSQEGLRLLSDAGAVLSSSLEFRQTIQALADLVVPQFCDWCAIDIMEEGLLQRLAVAHQEPEKVQLAHRLHERFPPRPEDPNGVYEVIRSGKSQLTREITHEMLVQSIRDEELLQIMRDLGLRSAMLVPIHSQGQTIGAMTLISSESARLYDEEDLVLAEELARRASEAVQNARLYQEAQKALQKANEAMRARDEFLAVVSHELKTPLTPILGWVNILHDTLPISDEDPNRHAVNIIERNARAQSQLINDLLDVSRIVTGKLQLDVRPLELHTVIEAAIETVRPAADAKAIDIITALDRSAGKVRGDFDRLQQVVWNLLSNAIKFTPKGGRVEVQLTRLDSVVQIMVRDDGQGIEEEFLPYVFDRFQQADTSTTRRYGGLGLGLSIVRHLTELHGGMVTVESAGTGTGSTFRVRLPLLAVMEEENSGEEAAANVPEDPDFLRSMNSQTSRALLRGVRILIVEDEADSRELIATVLKNFGAEVFQANSAASGFEGLLRWRPDLLLSDIGMPDEDGYSLIRRVRQLSTEDGGKTPAVALTAYARVEDRFRALAAGFQNHIAKPAEPAELAVTIASVLGRVGG